MKVVFSGTLCHVNQFWLKIINICQEMMSSFQTHWWYCNLWLSGPLRLTSHGEICTLKNNIFVISQQQQKGGYEVTSTGSNRQTPLQERLKNIFFQEKERKGKRRVHAADRPTFQRAATGLLPARQQGSFQVFFTCTSCPPTHNRPLCACLQPRPSCL